MADALASGASVLRDVGVQVPPLRPQRGVQRTPGAKVTNQKWVVTFVFVVHMLPALRRTGGAWGGLQIANPGRYSESADTALTRSSPPG